MKIPSSTRNNNNSSSSSVAAVPSSKRTIKLSKRLATATKNNNKRKKKHLYRNRQHHFISAASIAIFLVFMLLKQHDGKKVVVVSDPSHPNETKQTTTTTTNTVLERGKKIGPVVTAPELYKAYQEIQHEYHDKAFHEDNRQDWTVLNSHDGVEIAMLQHESDPLCPYVRMTAIMPTPVEDCWNFLRLANWDKTMPKMDPFYEGLSVFGEYHVGVGRRHKVHMILARKRTKRIVAFGKRDFVFVSVSDIPRGDGVWVSGTVSVITKQIPRRKGYTRAYQDSIAFYEPLEDNTKTKMTIVCRIDLNDHSDDGEGGHMPMWLYKKTIGTAGANSVKSMRHHLQLEYDQRERQKEKDEKKMKEQASAVSSSTATPKVGTLFRLPWKKSDRVEQDDADAVFQFESLEEMGSTKDIATSTRPGWKIPKLNMLWNSKTK